MRFGKLGGTAVQVCSHSQFLGVQIRYQERGGRDEEWLCLARCRFTWLSDLPAGCQPNPTFVPGATPTKEAAVEHKARRRPTNKRTATPALRATFDAC